MVHSLILIEWCNNMSLMLIFFKDHGTPRNAKSLAAHFQSVTLDLKDDAWGNICERNNGNIDPVFDNPRNATLNFRSATGNTLGGVGWPD